MIPDKAKFLDAVTNTITKHLITSYFKPSSCITIKKSGSSTAIEISDYKLGTKIHDKTMGNGTIVKIETLNDSAHLVHIKFISGQKKAYLLELALEKKTIEKINEELPQNHISIQTDIRKKQNQNTLEEGYFDVKNLFTQQSRVIRDRFGIRWVQCEACHEIKPFTDFASYGGRKHVNLGICKKCSNK